MGETTTRYRTSRSAGQQTPQPHAGNRRRAARAAMPTVPTATPQNVPTRESHLALAEGDLWLARCLALADHDAAPLPACAARWLTPHAYDEPLRAVELFALPSRSQPGRTHLVRYHAQTATLRCLSLEEALDTLCEVGYSGQHVLETGDLVSCIAGSFGRPCRHAGAAFAWVLAHDRWLARSAEQRAREERAAATDAEYWEAVLRRERPGGASR